MVNAGLLSIVVLFLAMGQFLFKRSGLALRGRPLVDGVRTLATLPSFYLAITLYGIATVMWIFVLSRVTLTQAYPWIAAGTVAVPLIGWFFFDERVTPVFWLGLAIMMVGLLLTQLGTRR